MAVRSACWSPRPVSGVITLGGDVPPEIEPSLLARLPATLVGRGARDEWYSQEKFERDVTRLREAGVDVRPFSFDAGHEWTPAFSAEAGEFLLAHAN